MQCEQPVCLVFFLLPRTRINKDRRGRVRKSGYCSTKEVCPVCSYYKTSFPKLARDRRPTSVAQDSKQAMARRWKLTSNLPSYHVPDIDIDRSDRPNSSGMKIDSSRLSRQAQPKDDRWHPRASPSYTARLFPGLS